MNKTKIEMKETITRITHDLYQLRNLNDNIVDRLESADLVDDSELMKRYDLDSAIGVMLTELRGVK